MLCNNTEFIRFSKKGMKMMERIAIVNTCDDGSTGKIAKGLKEHLDKQRYKRVLLCYGRGDNSLEDGIYRIDTKMDILFHAGMSRITGFQGRYSKRATQKLINLFEKNQIDTIYAVSLHGYYLNEEMFFDYIIKKGIKLIYIMIDEYPFLGKCGYCYDCTNYLSSCGDCPRLRAYPKSMFFDKTHEIFNMKYSYYGKFNDATFVGPLYTVESSKKSPLIKDNPNIRLAVLDESIDVERNRPRDNSPILGELGIDNSKIILVCVAPSSNPRKGCKYYIEAAKRLEKDNRFVFVHIGFVDEKNDLPSNYIPIGFVNDQEKLAQYYSMADLFVFPSIMDTMPNACLEALASGSPLLCFNTSGMPYIGDSNVMTLVDLKNVDQMIEVIKNTGKKNEDIISKCRNYALSRYDSRTYFSKLEDLGNKKNGEKE